MSHYIIPNINSVNSQLFGMITLSSSLISLIHVNSKVH